MGLAQASCQPVRLHDPGNLLCSGRDDRSDGPPGRRHQRGLPAVRPVAARLSPGLAFISANLGAIEILGMAANGTQYGLPTVRFYWIGAVPAMVFLGIVMMPFYYGSRVPARRLDRHRVR